MRSGARGTWTTARRSRLAQIAERRSTIVPLENDVSGKIDDAVVVHHFPRYRIGSFYFLKVFQTRGFVQNEEDMLLLNI